MTSITRDQILQQNQRDEAGYRALSNELRAVLDIQLSTFRTHFSAPRIDDEGSQDGIENRLVG